MRFRLIFILILFVSFQFYSSNAEEDQIIDEYEGDDADVVTEDDELPNMRMTGRMDPLPEPQDAPDNEENEDALKPIGPSPLARTSVLFVKPVDQAFHANAQVDVLVGFSNNGSDDAFVVDSMDAAFRYPQDYSYYIQNFTALRFKKWVDPGRHATFNYRFFIADSFQGRPFGLTLTLYYTNSNETEFFQEAVFNETVQILEPDEGLDGETFFMYLMLFAVGVLFLVGLQQLFVRYGKKSMVQHTKASLSPIERGTQSNSDVDYDWIPSHHLPNPKKSPGRGNSGRSPKQSPKQSPRQRKTDKKAANSN